MRDAASFLGKNYTTYVNHEKGYREPNAADLATYSKAYGVSIDYILGNTDEKNPTAESSGSETPIDELEAYARSLFSQLTIKGKIDAINEIQSLLQRQESQGGQQESD